MRIKQKDGVILYRASGKVRIFSLLVFAYLMFEGILELSEGIALSTMVFPIIIAIIALLGIAYRECWEFGENGVCSLWGFGPFVKRECFSYSEIAALELTHFVKGSRDNRETKRTRPMVILSLLLKDERTRTIEVIEERKSCGKTEEAAKILARETGLELLNDR